MKSLALAELQAEDMLIIRLTPGQYLEVTVRKPNEGLCAVTGASLRSNGTWEDLQFMVGTMVRLGTIPLEAKPVFSFEMHEPDKANWDVLQRGSELVLQTQGSLTGYIYTGAAIDDFFGGRPIADLPQMD